MDPEWWQRGVAAGAVVAVAVLVARAVDRALARRLQLPPEALTRYRVLRRSLVVAIVALGVLSGLLVIPQVRAAAGGVLASSAVVGLVVGMAARTTLANFVAGVLIAFTQPLRLGDEVEVADVSGTVEEIAVTYTVIRDGADTRFFVPNEKLASDTIRNATIGRPEHLAQVTIPVPLSSDLDRVLAILEDEARAAAGLSERQPVATVSELDPASSAAVMTVQAWAKPGGRAELESSIRRFAHRRLRAEGVL